MIPEAHHYKLSKKAQEAIIYEAMCQIMDHRTIGHSEQAQLCPHCKRYTKGVETRRQDTAYADDHLNYTTCCPECFVLIQSHWADQWHDYIITW